MHPYIKANKDRFLNELIELLKIPSISADSAYAGDVKRAADMVAIRLKEAGIPKVEVVETPGHPVVFGEKIIDPSLPTVMVYGHYDVQPPDPVELWDSPPFEPVIKKTDIHPDGAIFARGACDDKGQMYMHVKALELLNNNNELPCNVKLMIEGEEEVGSANLAWFIENQREKLDCDIILISDTGIIDNQTPSICVGLRGLSYVEVEVTGPNRDLHSGLYGGAAPNPLNLLSKMVASLQDDKGRITVKGFYDDVEVLSTEMREELGRAPFNEEDFKNSIGINGVVGEADYSVPERMSIRPTLDVNGMWGGYTGEGAKTVIPSKAYAKISMRLVPFQDPDKITDLFVKHFESIAPEGVTVKVTPHHGGVPYVAPTDTPAYMAASDAMESAYGKKPVPVRSGGSIPIVALFEEKLGAKSILMGFGLNSDAIHSPNEHYGLFNYFIGIETIAKFYPNFVERHQSNS
ncbi:MAG: dipeptidase [Cryomorphaceae bacterium]|nr:dipeptidase [Cryomorphaceae bacterium]